MERKTPKINFVIKGNITGAKVKIIEIIFLFACLQADCAQGSQLQCFTMKITSFFFFLLSKLGRIRKLNGQLLTVPIRLEEVHVLR